MEEGRGEASQMRLVSTRQAERAAQRAIIARERERQRISGEAERHEDVVAKTRRLRELRLAKEAAEREAAKADAREIDEASVQMKITAAQCRAGRMLAGLSQAELAGVAVVPATLITDYETGVGMPEPSDLEAIQSALEWAGVIFVEEDGHGPLVKLRK